MQRQFFAFILTTLVLVTACQPIQPLAHTAAGPTPIPLPTLTRMQIERWSSAAPDGQWIAEGLVAFPQSGNGQYYTELRVKKADGSVEWAPVAEWSDWGLGYTTPRSLRWSPDGRYLYFTNAPVPDGCGIFINGSDLQRLDLGDGNVLEVLPPNTTWSLAVAPDGKTVAYSKGDELHLLDLATANYAALRLEMLETDSAWGSIIWSPDSQQLAFTVAYAPCQPSQWRQSIVVADVRTRTVKTLIEKDERLLTTDKWLDADRIQLHDKEGKVWEMDVATGEEPRSYDLTPRYSRTELEQQAKEFIIKHAPGVDLARLTPQHGNKGHNYFFHWEDIAHRVEWAHPFVQVGLTQGGDLVTYVNTVTMSHAFINRAD